MTGRKVGHTYRGLGGDFQSLVPDSRWHRELKVYTAVEAVDMWVLQLEGV